MKNIFLLFLLVLFSQNFSLAQIADKAALKKAVNTLFEGMKNGDSAAVHAVFHDKVVMQGIHFSEKKQQQVFSNGGSLNDFLKAIGTNHDQIWDEKIGKIKVRIDGPLAHAWCNYQFFIGNNFSHCGVDSFTFVKLNNEWKIVQLIDTRRKENCPKL